MKKVMNIKRHRLTFPKIGISFSPDEIKKVSDIHFKILMNNTSIEEVKEKKIDIKKVDTKNKKIK